MRQSRAILLLLVALVIAGVVAFALTAMVDEAPTGAPTTSEPAETAEAVGGETSFDAQDRLAQADLLRAYAVALVYQVDHDGSYVGFDPKWARAVEPSILWAKDERASVGVVSINLASDDEVVLSTMSGSGTAFCLADSALEGQSRHGTVDAQGATSAADCVAI